MFQTSNVASGSVGIAVKSTGRYRLFRCLKRYKEFGVSSETSNSVQFIVSGSARTYTFLYQMSDFYTNTNMMTLQKGADFQLY